MQITLTEKGQSLRKQISLEATKLDLGGAKSGKNSNSTVKE